MGVGVWVGVNVAVAEGVAEGVALAVRVGLDVGAGTQPAKNADISKRILSAGANSRLFPLPDLLGGRELAPVSFSQDALCNSWPIHQDDFRQKSRVDVTLQLVDRFYPGVH